MHTTTYTTTFTTTSLQEASPPEISFPFRAGTKRRAFAQPFFAPIVPNPGRRGGRDERRARTAPGGTETESKKSVSVRTTSPSQDGEYGSNSRRGGSSSGVRSDGLLR